MRLFVAALVPEVLQSNLFQTLQPARRAAAQARWVRPGQVHLTLAFLGEQPDTLLGVLLETLRPLGSRHRVLQLTLQGVGCFGRPRRPDVLYAGLSGEVEGLRALQADVQTTLEAVCPRAEGAQPKAFHPHLTLARARGRHGDAALSRCQRALEERLGGAFSVDRVVLFQSQLGAGGALHTPLAEFPLSAEAPAA